MAPQQQGGQGGDNSLSVLWIIIGVFLGAYFIWAIARQYIVAFIFKLKLFEMYLIELFTTDHFYQTTLAPMQNQIYGLSQNLGSVTIEQVGLLSGMVGQYISIPIAVIMISLAAFAYFHNPTLKYKKKYDMKRLLTEERVNWPQINPVLNLDLVKEDINKGPWAMAQTPLLFGQAYDLLDIVETELEGSKRKVKEYDIHAAKANQVFSMQLGRLWQGVESLPEHAKALFGIFSARANHERGHAEKMTLQIARSAETGKLDFSGAEALIARYIDSPVVKSILSRHAYESTVFSTLLNLARSDGVLASADFLWLRPLDRSLWYVLNTIGRQTPFTEVAGIFAHWKAELDLSRKLYVPMVEQATIAFRIAVKEVKYIEYEQ